jgi:hypothetical protein
MASAIGLRGYLITAHKKGDPSLMPFDSDDFTMAPPDFITDFVNTHTDVVQNEERERSWYFEKRKSDSVGNLRGYVHYGTYGFESDFVDSKTKKKNYRRKVDDTEVIPLFFEFWCPEDAPYGFASFQSFQGRSCIQLVMVQMGEAFEAKNPGYRLQFKKLLPNDGSGSLYNNASVKRLRLIRRNAPSDVTDRYFGESAPSNVTFEVTLSARRKQSLGKFKELADSLNANADGIAMHDGIAFNEAIAEVKIGGRVRRVGVFGSGGDAGVIDITDTIVRGDDGHPTFESLQKQSDLILVDFEKILANKKS